ncbi:DMT family transporter [Megalodesulfovibrio paquesii]
MQTTSASSKTLLANGILLLTACIWGFAFVAQRVGMDHLGPFAFNGIRFLLGAASLLPLILYNRAKGRLGGVSSGRGALLAGMGIGVLLFVSASLQQIGVVTTTAGNAGFLTGLYVILVPVIGLWWGQRTGAGTWIGAVLAVAGMWLLSVQQGFHIVSGDIWVMASAVGWALHVLLVGNLAQKIDALVLSCVQFVVCGVLSLLTALLVEDFTTADVAAAGIPILYGGLMSVGVAYTLQVVGQQWAKASHAAIILSLEGAFAALGGWWLLGETLSLRQFLGCALMLAGMLVSQCWPACQEKPAVE